MYRLGLKVYIVGDQFEQKLPIGDYGYIIAYDRNADNVFEYVLRVPSMNKHVYVTAQDIESEEELVIREVDRIEREALIDFALATRNEALFRRVLNGEDAAHIAEEINKDVQSREDFLRQVHLKAWI